MRNLKKDSKGNPVQPPKLAAPHPLPVTMVCIYEGEHTFVYMYMCMCVCARLYTSTVGLQVRRRAPESVPITYISIHL